MKKYDFIQAIEIIKASKNIIEAKLGIHEDWAWTAERFWDLESGFNEEIIKEKKVAGIDGSNWATPVLFLTFKNGSEELIDCFISDGNDIDPLEKVSKSVQITGGVISRPCQEWMDQKISKKLMNLN